jgi:hypothetical protein
LTFGGSTFDGNCHNPSLGLATKARGVVRLQAKREAQESSHMLWRAPKSRGETHLKVPQSQVAESWDLEARSRLPTLERGRRSSWEPRD